MAWQLLSGRFGLSLLNKDMKEEASGWGCVPAFIVSPAWLNVNRSHAQYCDRTVHTGFSILLPPTTKGSDAVLRAQTGSNEQAGKNGSCWQKSLCKTATGCAAKPNYTIPVGRFFSSAPCIESSCKLCRDLPPKRLTTACFCEAQREAMLALTLSGQQASTVASLLSPVPSRKLSAAPYCLALAQHGHKLGKGEMNRCNKLQAYIF